MSYDSSVELFFGVLVTDDKIDHYEYDELQVATNRPTGYFALGDLNGDDVQYYVTVRESMHTVLEDKYEFTRFNIADLADENTLVEWYHRIDKFITEHELTYHGEASWIVGGWGC